MEAERENLLKFGEQIIIITSSKYPAYLAARSLIEEQVYFIQVVNSLTNIMYYDNHQECLFTILPKLRFEAIKNYKKAKKQKDLSQDKLEIIKKRVRNEEELNKSIIERNNGKPIAIGDEIHLLHVLSGSYVKCLKHTYQNNQSNAEVHNLKASFSKQSLSQSSIQMDQKIAPLSLSDSLCSRVLFKIKIDPYYTFKRDGEKISYEDKFYFESEKQKSSIIARNNEKVNTLVNQINMRGINCPNIIENSAAFDVYSSGHQITDLILTFQAIKIHGSEDKSTQDQQTFYWGDFVRIKHIILKDDKAKQAYIQCKTNINGFSPYLYLSSRDSIMDEAEKDSISSIFQIVPDDLDKLGKKIQIVQNSTYPPIMFRHWLTGKFMRLSKDNLQVDHNLEENLMLSKSINEKLQDNSVQFQRQNTTIIPKSRATSPAKRKNASFSKQNNFIPIIDITQQLSYYLEGQTVTIQSAQPDEKFLSTKSCFTISETRKNDVSSVQSSSFKTSSVQSSFVKEELKQWEPLKQSFEGISQQGESMDIAQRLYLHVIADKQVNYNNLSNPEQEAQHWLSKNYFKNTFYQNNTQQKETFYKADRSSSQKDFFFLELVKQDEISDVVSVLSKLQPFVKLINNPNILTNIKSHTSVFKQDDIKSAKENKQLVEQAEQSLVSLCFWLCNSENTGKLDLIDDDPDARKQKVLREVGLIEMIVNILYYFQDFNIIKTILENQNRKNDILYTLIQTIIEFLRLSCRNNLLNTYFLSQWYHLLKNIVLKNEIPMDIKIDQLLSELFLISDLGNFYQSDVGLISKSLEFERNNIQALKLLLGFCSDFEQSNQQRQKFIVEQLFQQNRDKLFREFFYNSKICKLGIKLAPDKYIYIDKNLEFKNQDQFQYITTSLLLSSLICKGESNYVIQHIEKLCPLQTCIQAISDKNIPSKVRAIFIQLLLTSYLKSDSRYVIDKEYPCCIKRSPDLSMNENILKQIQQIRCQFEEKYCSQTIIEGDQVCMLNLKEFLFAEFLDLKNGEILDGDESTNHLIISLLDMLHLFLKKKFFSNNEISLIHTILDELLKNAFTFIHHHTLLKKDKDIKQFDIQKSLVWVKQTIDVLTYIEMFEQNQIMKQFFSLEYSQQLFTQSAASKNVYDRQDFLKSKKDHVEQFISCLEIPDVEVIYYYFRLIEFNTNDITSSVVKLIYQIFNMKVNILNNFNDILYVHQGNLDASNTFYELYFKLHVYFVDLRNMQEGNEQKQKMIDMYDVLVKLCKSIFDKFIDEDSKPKGQSLNSNEEKNINDLENGEDEEDEVIPVEKSTSYLTQKVPKMTKSPSDLLKFHGAVKLIDVDREDICLIQKSEEFQKRDSSKVLQDKIMKIKMLRKVEKQEDQFQWSVLTNYSFDIRKVLLKQDIIRHLKLHKLHLNIILYFTSSKLEISDQILEKSVLFLIYFCLNNQKNQIEIAENPNFQEIYLSLLERNYQKDEMMQLLMMLISEIFRNNYQLLINLQTDHVHLFQQLAIHLKLKFQLENYDYCIYYFQLLEYFFKVKSAQLIQNQLWTFHQIYYVNNLQSVFQQLLQDCVGEQIQEITIDENRYIIVSDRILTLCGFLNVFQKLMQDGKSHNKVRQESKNFFSLEQVKSTLKELQDFYFLKQLVLQFLITIYMKNKKLEEKEILDIMMILKEEVLCHLMDYIERYNEIQDNDISFINEKPNIFSQSTTYSTETKLINCKVSTAADCYIYYGVIYAFEEYRKRFLVEAQYNEIDFQFMDDYQKYFSQLLMLWREQPKVQNQAASSNNHLQSQKSYRSEDDIDPVNAVMTQDKEVKFKILKEQLVTLYDNYQFTTKVKIMQSLQQEQFQIQEKTETLWEKLKSLNMPFLDSNFIDDENEKQMNQLVGLLVKIREENVHQFKVIIQNLIKLLAEQNTQNEVKKLAVSMLRNLGNFRLSEKQQKAIRNDLCELGFTNFMCQVISNENTDQSDKLDYIECLLDFLEEGIKVQKNFKQYLFQDEENQFIITIRDYIWSNFNDFKEYEKGLANQSGKIQEELRSVIDKKINSCNQAICIFKMSSEGHFAVIQNYVREQVINGRHLSNNINLLKFCVNIFGQYCKFVSPFNVQFGETILDFLSEVIQGPCPMNQTFLSDSKILENLEDLMYDFVKDIDTLKVHHVMMASFTKRIYIFILSLFEGSQEQSIVQKIENYLNPLILLKRLKFIYTYVNKTTRKEQLRMIQERLEGVDQPEKGGDLKNKATTHFIQNNLDDIFNEEEEAVKKLTLEEIEELYGPGLDNLVQEGEQIYILLRNMRIQSNSFKEKFRNAKRELLISYQQEEQEIEIFEKTQLYYKLNTGRIEIINNQTVIQILFFPKPELAQYLSESSQMKFLDTVNRDTANEKIQGLLYVVKDFISEMKHFRFLMTNVPFNLDETFTIFRWIVLFCAFIINFLLLFDYYVEECDECIGSDPILTPCVCTQNTPTKLGKGIDIFGLVLFAFNVFTFVLWACLKLKLDLSNAFNCYENEKKQKEKSQKIKKNQNTPNVDIPVELLQKAQEIQRLMEDNFWKYIYVAKFLALNSYFLYLSLYASVTLMGINYHRLMFTLLLLDIIERSIVLQNVIKSISINSTQLIMTGLLGMVIMFIYGMMAYYNTTLHSSMKGQAVPICTDPFNCFMFIVNLGMRAGGGVGDQLWQPNPSHHSYLARFFYDLTFFLLIIVIWMNIIFGIIIDTFASLRDFKNQQDADRRNKCFICSQERTIFEKYGIFFGKHTEKEHNVWSYFFYIVYLEEKESIDYNGTESYIKDKIDIDDISWFPIGKAESLKKQDETHEDRSQKILEEIQNNLDKIFDLQDKFKQTDFNSLKANQQQ